MHQRELRLRLEVAEPVEKTALVGMRGQAADGVHRRVDALVLAVDAHPLRAIDQAPAQRAHALVADEHHMRAAPAEVVPEVVEDAPAVGHAAAGDDDRTAFEAVDRHRLLGARGDPQVRQLERIRLAAPDLLCVVVEQRVMVAVHLDHLAGHRAVQEHLPARQVPLVPVPGEPVQQFLRAPHRERRDQHVAAVAPGLLQDLAELDDGLGAVLVVAVAVGRFHQHQVGLADRGRIAQDRRALGTEVAGEHQLAAIRPHFDDAGTEDVAGIAERDLDAIQHSEALVVGLRPQQLDGVRDVFPGVQRLHFPFAMLAPAVEALGIAFGQRSRIHQHDRHQLGAGALGEDRAAEAALDQQRHPADMVDVRMAHHQCVDGLDIERKRIGIARLHFRAALAHAAIEQDALARGFEQVHRTRHLAGRTVEMHLHADTPCPESAERTSATTSGR